LLAVRPQLPRGDADAIEFDEDAKWLCVTRGEFQLVCNFSGSTARIPVGRARIHLASPAARIEGETLVLDALGGALLR
jgi:uncharacterized protein DUF3459